MKFEFIAGLVSWSLFVLIFGSKFGRSGLLKPCFRMEGIAKNSFSHMSGLCRFWCHFYMVFDGFGTNFDDFWWLGDRLKIA